MDEWIDISAEVFSGMVHWPGEPEVSLYKVSDINQGGPANVTALSMCAHTGTHMDAPRHFFPEGKDISQIPLDECIGHAKVIHISDPKKISLEEIQNYNIEKNDRILFRTHNSDNDWTGQPFRKDKYVYLSTEAAKFLADKKISLVGVDYISIGSQDNGKAVHQIILGAGIWIIEGLLFKNVPEGQYEMICLPLKLIGSDGAPARALLKRINNPNGIVNKNELPAN